MLDGDLRVLFVNAALRTALGYEPAASTADLLERAGYDVVRADGTPWPLDERPVQRAAQAGQASRRLLMGLVRDGTTRWVRVSAWPLGPGTGQGAVGTYTDVTERERDRRALVESEAHFRLLAENSTDVITRHSADGTCLYASPALREVLGREPAELEGSLAIESVHPEDAGRLLDAHVDLLRSGSGTTVRYRMAHRDGRWVWVETVMRPVRASDGWVLEMQSSTRDVTARVESEQRLARLALGDPLTGLANRAALLQHLGGLLDARVPLALLFLDLDRFKVVNDSLGHSAGDELLRTVAGRLSGACRDGDLVARLGGDEFVVVAARLDEAGAVQLSDRVLRVLAAPVAMAGHELVASASLGIVVHHGPADGRDAEALLRDADVSMYRAKAAGRARAVVWTEGTGEAPQDRLTLEEELRNALEQGQIEVHYQPQVELVTGRVVGVEALVRWDHPTRGLLLPGAFLAVAEESGLIVELGRQVLRASAGQVVAWRQLPGCEQLALSVNLSGRELLEPAALEDALGVLAQTGLPAAALTLEVLESVLLDVEGQVVAALGRYVAHGVRLALDDFGTGSSTLLHLRRVPVAAVKIDRVFVGGLGRSRQDEAVVRALVSLTRDLGMACIAEGVEDDAQRAWLLDQGVSVAQGYRLHPPLPAAAVEALLQPAGRQDGDG